MESKLLRINSDYLSQKINYSVLKSYNFGFRWLNNEKIPIKFHHILYEARLTFAREKKKKSTAAAKK